VITRQRRLPLVPETMSTAPGTSTSASGDHGSPNFDIAAPVDKAPALRLRVGCIVTDEDPSVRAMIRYEFKGLLHESYPWHLRKSIMKRFHAAAEKARNATLRPWIPSISNWIWTSMKECDGGGDLLIEHWRSILYHIIGARVAGRRVIFKRIS
jgi:hypothetical protein